MSLPARPPRSRPASGRAADEVSALDKRIIEHLQADGRRPYTQIAVDLGVSEAAVRARTNRLIERGILQVVGVNYVVITSGTYYLLIETVCEDNEALLAFLAERLRAVDGVNETETFVYLRLVKQTYQYGTR